MTFSKKLSAEMDARNWKPIHLAAALLDRGDSVHIVTVERWMDGSSEPTVSRAKLVADILEMSLDDISAAPDRVTA